MYMIAIVVSFFLLYLFGFKIHAASIDSFMKLVFIVAMPCAVGAAIPNMLRPN